VTPAGPEPSPDAVCDGGDLDCGSGLLLVIRRAMQPLGDGAVLEVRSREPSVAVDLPAWCRLVGHAMLDHRPGDEGSTSYFLRKKGADRELTADLDRAREHVWSVRVRSSGDSGGMLARAYARNHAFDVGQPASFDTEDAAPSAIEYVLAALAGCLAVGLRMRASRRSIELHQLEVTLRARIDNVLVFLGIEDEGDPGLSAIEGRVFVETAAADSVVEELWRETLARSPVLRTLTREVPVEIERRTV
jgi:uncharacterized OsmC-like protein/TusA-related sulfurtransferase